MSYTPPVHSRSGPKKIVPRTETEADAHRALTAGQVDEFRQRGFITIGPLLSDSEIEELRGEYDRIFAEARETSQLRNLSVSDGDSTAGGGEEMLQIMQMCERSLLFRRLLYDERILDIAEDLIGPNLQLFHDQALYKPPFCGGPIHWHQDNAYWGCIPANLVSCWITFDDVDATNGAMHLIPGSHLLPADHERPEDSALLDGSDRIDASDADVVVLPAGGVMFHHCQAFHHTPPNATNRQRRAFAIHFMNPGTRSLKSSTFGVSFARPLLRRSK